MIHTRTHTHTQIEDNDNMTDDSKVKKIKYCALGACLV